MIQCLLTTLALVNSVTLADYAPNDSATTITWIGRKNMVWWTMDEQDSWPKSPKSNSNPPSLLEKATRTAMFNDFAFLAFPRAESPNVPITLAQMSLKGNEHNQHPFPNMEMQEKGNCTALQNIVDIYISRKGHLWALDAGMDLCKPKIVAFYALTGQVARTIDMSNLEGKESPSLRNIVVDHNWGGEDFVYVSDSRNRKIFVISGEPVCIRSIQLPDVAVRDVNSSDITLNLLSQDTSSLLLVNDERQEQIFHLEVDNIRVCSKLPRNLLGDGRRNNKVFLGTSVRGSIYCRRKTYDGVVYELGILDSIRVTSVYKGSASALPTHVVPDQMTRGIRLLESYKSEHANIVVQSLKLIQKNV